MGENKMIRKISLAIILIFLITGIGFAFQNEPDGFRGLKWGDAPTEDMNFYCQFGNKLKDEDIEEKGNYYEREKDKLNIGNAEIRSITYIFTLYSNQFYEVRLRFYDINNYDILKIICEGRFGEPTYKDKKSRLLYWTGDKTEICLYMNDKEVGVFFIKSMKIRIETLADKPEHNKQKELEKAEEDF